MAISRREFVCSAVGAAAAAGAGVAVGRPLMAGGQAGGQVRKGPIAVSSANGIEPCNLAVGKMRGGMPPVDAAVAGVNLIENDPNDTSVGYGGVPNEEGVVELDSCVMDGPSHKAGAVASIQKIKTPSSVALLVMRRTDHVLIVGDGARRFAKAHGFKEENLLTDKARKIWLRWKEKLSGEDDWLSPQEDGRRAAADSPVRGQDMTPDDRHGTINLCAMNEAGDLGGVTTTSGLAFKIPGRVGDSPIIGAGLFVDNEVGAAGSTGRGEANLQNCASFMVVEMMRNGMTPEEACLAVLKRVADKCEPQLRNDKGEPNFGLTFYALRKDGMVGGATMRRGGKMAFHDGTECKKIDIPGLF